MSRSEQIVLLLAAVGVAFMVVSSIGIVRLPDVFSRMHAGGKASTVGIGGLLLAAGLFFFNEFVLYRVLLLIALLFATLPIASSAIARAAYRTSRPKKNQLHYDEMAQDTDRHP